MSNKPFNKVNYERNDSIGKSIVRLYLRRIGVDTRLNPKKYDVDVIPMSNYYNNFRGWECELRNLNTNKWPYPTVHIPPRKEHYLTDNIIYSIPIAHHLYGFAEYSDEMVITDTYYTLMFCASDIISKYSKCRIKRTETVKEGESFIVVPYYEFTNEIDVSRCALPVFLNEIDEVMNGS